MGYSMKRILASFLIVVSIQAHLRDTKRDPKSGQAESLDVCKEFMQEQDENVNQIITAYDNEVAKHTSALRGQLAEELLGQYRQDCQTSKSKKSQEWFYVRWGLWWSSVETPVSPTDTDVNKRITKAIDDEEDREEVKAIVGLKARLQYYQHQYPEDRKELGKLTPAQIEALFLAKNKVLEGKGNGCVHEEIGGRLSARCYEDYNFVPEKGGKGISSNITRPVGIVLMAGGRSKVEDYLQRERLTRERLQKEQAEKDKQKQQEQLERNKEQKKAEAREYNEKVMEEGEEWMFLA